MSELLFLALVVQEIKTSSDWTSVLEMYKDW